MNSLINKYLSKVKSLTKKIDVYSAWLYIILFFALLVRVVDLNYNSAFNDEAIYIVIGRLGLFANDWWSYGAKLWMAGLPYIYPSFTALAYEAGGLVGSRLLNVIFGIVLLEEVYRFVKLLNLFDKKTNSTAALIATFLAAFSGIGMFVSKLATYDMPSFMLLFLGINSYLKARQFSNGKYYFLTFLFLFVAFLTKIVVAVFFPILFVISLLMLKERSKAEKKTAITYLYVPFILATLVYVFSYRDNLMTYVNTHKDLGKSEGGIVDIISLIWRETYQLFLLSIPATFIIAFYKKTRNILLALIPLILAIPLFHIVLTRYATLDKHLYLVAIFLSVIVGYGFSVALLEKNKIISLITKIIIPIIVVIYMLTAFRTLSLYEHEWHNAEVTVEFLRARVKPGDKILTEEGSSIALGLYDIILPPKSIVTFDWINYSGLENDRGYIQAVKEVYFDYIELDSEFEGKEKLREDILKNLSNNYHLIHKEGTFEVYAKN